MASAFELRGDWEDPHIEERIIRGRKGRAFVM